jgi:hypothetical protein
MANQEDTDILVSQEDFNQAFCDLVPSVSQSEMDHYASIQQRFSRTKPTDGIVLLNSAQAIKAGHNMNQTELLDE